MLVTASVNFQKFAFMTIQIKLYRRMERLKASWQSCQMCVCVCVCVCKTVVRGETLKCLCGAEPTSHRYWCAANNLLCNSTKTKELIVDIRRENGDTHDPIHIDRTTVEPASSSWEPTSPGPTTPPAWSRRFISTSSSWRGTNCTLLLFAPLVRC